MSISVLECYKLISIIKKPRKQWDKVIISNILVACVSLHNMMIENEKLQIWSLVLMRVGFNYDMDCHLQNKKFG
jgi:hypothetical protein